MTERPTRTTPSPELTLLLACARGAMRPEDRAAAERAIAGGVDWERAHALAEQHGLLPLLNRHLTAAPLRALLPPAVVERYTLAGRRWGARGLWIANELATLLRELAAAGIPAMPVKGPLLSQLLYGSVAMRQSVDLDVLVRREDLTRAGDLLVRRGFTSPSWGVAEIDALQRATVAEIAFHAPAPTYCVELHQDLQLPDGRARFGYAEFADRLTRGSLHGTDVRTLAPEDLLAYLCVHGGKHAWGRIGWVTDVAELVRGGHVTDWARVADAARLLRAPRQVRTGLLLARELLGAPVPDAQLGADRRARRAVRTVIRRLVEGDGREPSTVEEFTFQLGTDSSVGARLRRLQRLARPAVAERVAFPLPKLLRPLYLILRPVRLLLTHGPVRVVKPPTPRADRSDAPR